jgi:iron-sulfur cluster assembly protein
MELNPVSLSPLAAQEIRQIMQTKSIPPNYGLRIMVEGGGCSARYRLGFDSFKAGDQSYQVEGIPIFYEKRQLLFLIGVRLDFEEREAERGFIFRNTPQAQS